MLLVPQARMERTVQSDPKVLSALSVLLVLRVRTALMAPLDRKVRQEPQAQPARPDRRAPQVQLVQTALTAQPDRKAPLVQTALTAQSDRRARLVPQVQPAQPVLPVPLALPDRTA